MEYFVLRFFFNEILKQEYRLIYKIRKMLSPEDFEVC